MAVAAAGAYARAADCRCGAAPQAGIWFPAKGTAGYVSAWDVQANSEEIDMATTKNVRWVAKVGSQAYGNPVVAGGHIYIARIRGAA